VCLTHRLHVIFRVLRRLRKVLEAAFAVHAASFSFFSCVHRMERELEATFGVEHHLGWLVTWQETRVGVLTVGPRCCCCRHRGPFLFIASLSVEKNCLHPSLEGRGQVVAATR